VGYRVAAIEIAEQRLSVGGLLGRGWAVRTTSWIVWII